MKRRKVEVKFFFPWRRVKREEILLWKVFLFMKLYMVMRIEKLVACWILSPQWLILQDSYFLKYHIIYKGISYSILCVVVVVVSNSFEVLTKKLNCYYMYFFNFLQCFHLLKWTLNMNPRRETFIYCSCSRGMRRNWDCWILRSEKHYVIDTLQKKQIKSRKKEKDLSFRLVIN